MVSSKIRKLRRSCYRIGKSFALKQAKGRVSFDPGKAIVLSADPRGGSTWLMETMQTRLDCALLWEPLKVNEVPELGKIGFGWSQYIGEEVSWPNAEEFFASLFSGKILNPSICSQTSASQLVSAQYLMIKFCRASQLLPWLTTKFNFEFAPLYLVRHPCAVVASQLAHGAWANHSPFWPLDDIASSNHYTLEDTRVLEDISTVEQRLAARWALNNRVPLNHDRNNTSWVTITYEQMLSEPVSTIGNVARRWNLPGQGHQDKASLYLPSRTTRGDSPILYGDIQEQLRSWERRLSERQISNVLETVAALGVNLYDRDPMPRCEFM